ncbi:MAG: phosphopantothenoylcysteine decarboxylase [archaeon]
MALEVLITSGGTVAKIDDVRNLGNFSSGTTGSYIAEEFLKRGANIHYVYGKNAKRPFREELKMNPKKSLESEFARLALLYRGYQMFSPHLQEYPITTFEEYYERVKGILTQKKIDVVVLAAAVGDYGYSTQGGKLSSDEEKLTLEFVKNPKIISHVKEWNPQVYQVGFKLLSRVSEQELIETAYRHGIKNHSDLTVANTLEDGSFAKRKIFFITPEKEVAPVSERNLAFELVGRVLKEVE